MAKYISPGHRPDKPDYQRLKYSNNVLTCLNALKGQNILARGIAPGGSNINVRKPCKGAM